MLELPCDDSGSSVRTTIFDELPYLGISIDPTLPEALVYQSETAR
mgnify:CR=1 FL=1